MEISKKEMGLVKYIAFTIKQKHKLPIDLDELVSIGLEGFVKAKHAFDPAKGSFNTFLYIKVRGAILDFARLDVKANFTENYIKQDFVAIQSKVENNIDRVERIKIIKRIIDSFDYKERKMLKLYYYEEKTLDDIAGILGIEKSWASRLHQRTLKKLTARTMARVY